MHKSLTFDMDCFSCFLSCAFCSKTIVCFLLLISSNWKKRQTIKLTVQFVNERKMCFEEEIFFFFYFLKFHFCSDRRCVLTQCNSHINFIVGPFSHSRWKTITDFIWTKWIEQSHHSMQMVAVFLSPCVEARER